jgi:hypothetical protein
MSKLQQVNLYGPEFQSQKQPFSFRTILMTWGILIVFFGSLQSWGWYQVQNTQDKLITLEQQQVNVLQQLEHMRGTTPRNRNAQLDVSINKFQVDVERRRQVLYIMKDQILGNESGFSDYLLGLSRQAINGLSLEYIGLLRGGSYVELSGWTRRAELVPSYVQKLQKENSFRNAHFGDMAIERMVDQRTDALRFRLGEAEKGGS